MVSCGVKDLTALVLITCLSVLFLPLFIIDKNASAATDLPFLQIEQKMKVVRVGQRTDLLLFKQLLEQEEVERVSSVSLLFINLLRQLQVKLVLRMYLRRRLILMVPKGLYSLQKVNLAARQLNL